MNVYVIKTGWVTRPEVLAVLKQVQFVVHTIASEKVLEEQPDWCLPMTDGNHFWTTRNSPGASF